MPSLFQHEISIIQVNQYRKLRIVSYVPDRIILCEENREQLQARHY